MDSRGIVLNVLWSPILKVPFVDVYFNISQFLTFAISFEALVGFYIAFGLDVLQELHHGQPFIFRSVFPETGLSLCQFSLQTACFSVTF